VVASKLRSRSARCQRRLLATLVSAAIGGAACGQLREFGTSTADAHCCTGWRAKVVMLVFVVWNLNFVRNYN